MEIEVLATLLGVALAALVGACGAGFRWMRSDFRDLRSHVDTRFKEQTTTTNAQFAEVNGRLDRLEAKFDDLIMALARSGSLIDPLPAAPRSPPPAPKSTAADQPLEPAPAPTEPPTARSLPSEQSAEIVDPPRAPPATGGQPAEIVDPPRAPPATGGQPAAEQPYRPPPAEPFGPTAAPA